jgi:hypothetical protein
MVTGESMIRKTFIQEFYGWILRIGFFLGELYGLSCCVCDIDNVFLYVKTREKVYTTAGPKFGSTQYGKNLIINELLYGLKNSAASFHEHLAESQQ